MITLPIFLHSCLNAAEGRGADNLANFFIKIAEGRTIYAGTDSFASSSIEVDTIYPFKITSIKNAWGREILYTNSP